MKGAALPAALMAATVAGAAVLRCTNLSDRPMHCDEAVHAIKFGRLLERGEYVYDPREYHGPSLNMFTLPVTRSVSVSKLTQVTEAQLRFVTAVCGIVLVGLVWALRCELGMTATLFAAAGTAISPAMVFYSRYYIQETLLVLFTFSAMVGLWRSFPALTAAGNIEPAVRIGLRRRLGWLFVLGLSIGMLHATKETCVLVLLAMAVAGSRTLWGRMPLDARRFAAAALFVVCAAAGTSALFFSSLLSHPRGVVDSYAAYFHYFSRAAGEGSAGPHVHPWYYYFQVLFWWQRDAGPVWTELPIALLSLAGAACAAWGRGLAVEQRPFARFVALFTLLLMAVYCAIPYKTPWCALGFLHGLILLAAIGAAALVRTVRGRLAATALALVLLAALLQLGWQMARTNFLAADDPHNPYVYSHTARDVLGFVQQTRRLARCHPEQLDVHIQVICPDDDYWPLPWYLRDFRRVGWFAAMPPGRPAALIITQPSLEAELIEYLYTTQPPGERSLYVPISPPAGTAEWYLRPHVPLRLFATLELWEAYQAGSSDR